jgi:hypothetical protein
VRRATIFAILAVVAGMRAGAHSDSNIGFHQRRSIIDAVANHRDGLAGPAEFPNAIQFL